MKTDGKTIEVLAKIDTGASDCLFERGYGEALGLRVEDGLRKPYATANSRFEAYARNLDPGSRHGDHGNGLLFADTSIARNVLGWCGWLDRLRFGLVDYENVVYISNYNT